MMGDLEQLTVRDCDHPVRHTAACFRKATDAELLVAVAPLFNGAEVREAVPVLPGGPPRWLDAKGPGRYLVIPLLDKEMPK